MQVAIAFQQVSRHYGAVKALDQVSFAVQGRRVLLHARAIRFGQNHLAAPDCRFEQPSSGSLQLSGKEAAGTPPYARDVNTVFQDYACFRT